MKRLILPAAILMFVPLLAPTAEAHPAPYPHRHVRHVRRVRVYHPPPRRVIIEESPPPVVVEKRPVVVREQREDDYQMLGIGLRLSTATLEGDKVGLTDAENPAMAGVGVQLRSRFDKHLGLELAFDHLSGGDGDFTQTTMPLTLSLTYHLLPESRLQPYFLAGGGVQFTRLSYLDDRYAIDSTEIVGQIGGGVEVFLSKSFSLHADLRGQTVFKNLDTQEIIREDCLSQVGGMSGFCDNIHDADPNDKANLGLQLQVGASLYF